MELLFEKGTVRETIRVREVVFHKSNIVEMFAYGHDEKNLFQSEFLPVIRLNNDYIMETDAFFKWVKQIKK